MDAAARGQATIRMVDRLKDGVRPLKMAIVALGGQGGGVVADWLIDVARRENYLSQATSVPGVAQRTGATIYYLEFYPHRQSTPPALEPVFGLMPLPADVDLVASSELLEGCRAVLRGFVTPDRTTLVTSTHRSYTIAEKSNLTDGRIDADLLLTKAPAKAKLFIAYDMEKIADTFRSVISAVLLGGIAGSGALPFASESYRDAIRDAGISVERSLDAFNASLDLASRRGAAIPPAAAPISAVKSRGAFSTRIHPDVSHLLHRVCNEFPRPLQNVLKVALRRLVDYQDPRYASDYLDKMAHILSQDDAAHDHRLTIEVARGLALWMTFEDTFRVADLKTRGARVSRIREEVQAPPAQVLQVTEFMKPRVEEICGSLPTAIGRFLLRSPKLLKCMQRFAGDRQISTSTLLGFLFLRLLARAGYWRRSTLRFIEETARIDSWLSDIRSLTAVNYDLALEVAACHRLVKGYGATHERGLMNYARVIAAAKAARITPGVAADLRRWREAALADDDGIALDNALLR